MKENQLSRYGAISRTLPDLAPGAKFFLVSDSDDTTVGPLNIGHEFPPDKDGVTRVYTTIQAAVNACTSNRGDHVYVLPGYNRSLGATADSWNVAGVSIIGLGYGTMRPTITYDNKAGTIDVGASNVRVSGLRFLASADSIARGIDADTAFTNFRFDHNIFDFSANTYDFRVMVRLGQARSIVEDNEFRAEDTAGAGKGVAIWGGYPDYSKIRRNYFYGQFDTVGDTSNTSGAIACDSAYDSGDTDLSGIEISENVIVSTDTAASTLLNLGGAGVTIRGIARDNKLVAYDTAVVDTVAFTFGGIMPMRNLMLNGDSDTTCKVVEWSLQAP